MNLPTREKALEMLQEHVKEPYQILHAKMVARAMEFYADRFGADQNLWYITGLLHDIDYYESPTEHPNQSLQWFRNWDYPEEMIHAIAAHAHSSGRTTTEPSTPIDFALIACDELSGLLYAYSLMKPEKFKGMEASSAMKKYKNKGFAAKIDREEIMLGVTGLKLDLKEHIQYLIQIFENMPECN